MKQKIYIALIVLFFSGCKKFLDVQPKDLKIPSTVKDYQDLLNGQGWSGSRPSNGMLFWLDMMTDDITEKQALATSYKLDEKINYSAFYTWRNNYDYTYINDLVSSYTLNAWTWLYQIVMTTNIVLEDAPNAEGSEADRNFLMADAYFSRALAYFYILNIWGEPYNPSTVSSAKGVPIKKDSYPEMAGTQRSSVKEVYDFIIDDLTHAEAMIISSGKTSSYFHVSKEAVETLLARVYLYTQDWANAKSAADRSIATRPGLYDISTENFASSLLKGNNNFINIKNNEILYTYCPETYYTSPVATGELFGTGQSNSMYVLADTAMYNYRGSFTADKRLNGFTLLITVTGSGSFRFPKTVLKDTTGGLRIQTYDIRVAETYLNRAEANAQLNNLSAALADINYLRSKRIEGVVDTSIADKAGLLQFIYAERRRELLYQSHRWFDLRRQGMPSITHTYTPTVGSGATAVFGTPQTFVLNQNDPGYTIEIPIKELNYNPLVTPLGLPLREPQ